MKATTMACRAGKSPLVLFGAQSGRPTEADVVKTLEDAKSAGYSCFIVYPRSGLEYEYMGEEWLALVGHYLKHAERLGIDIWLYDEFNWPSGSCKGKVTENHPEFANKTCALYRRKDGSFDWRLFDADPLSANVFDENAMKRFRELTHAVYEKCFRRYFGTVIKAIFTDEPGSVFWTAREDAGSSVKFRWYARLEEDYRAETGRNFRTDVESYCRAADEAHEKGVEAAVGACKVWEDYTAVMGHAFRRAFIDPITSWCDKMGIASTGHLGEEMIPSEAARFNGLVLHVLKGLSFPGVDETFTRTGAANAEWLTFATAQHAISRRGSGGMAELFALGPCDLPPDRMLQMIWLLALHKVDTYVMALHHQTARGFADKPHYAMFHSPLQPWFFLQESLHNAARQAAEFARKPYRYDVAVRYRERAFGREHVTGTGVKMPLVELLGELESHQFAVNLLEEDEPSAEAIVFDFDGTVITEAGGRRFPDVYSAMAFAETETKRKRFRVFENSGEAASDIVARHYCDGSAAFLNLRDCTRSLVLAIDGASIPFSLPCRGVWIFQPIADEWSIALDRGNRRRIRFLADGTAKVVVERPTKVRFATCAVEDAAAHVTLDGAPLSGSRQCTFLGQGYDCDYLETGPMELAAGEHAFTCEGREDRGLFLPVLWMEGDFSVCEPGTVMPIPQAVRCGPLAAVGLGDFAGAAMYSAEVDVPKGANAVVLGTGHAAARVRLAGHDLGTRLFAPWRYEIPVEIRGCRAKIEIEITTSARPMFGAESDDVPGALPSNKPEWMAPWLEEVVSESNVGLLFAVWSIEK